MPIQRGTNQPGTKSGTGLVGWEVERGGSPDRDRSPLRGNADLVRLARASDQLEADLEETMGRLDRARSYVLDQGADLTLSGLLLNHLVRRREVLGRRLESLRDVAAQVVATKRPPIDARV